MKQFIIGISGELNSGKDTVASMINYMMIEGSKANYATWLTSQVKYSEKLNRRVVHFADPLKDCLSIMYNIDRKLFDSREHKDVLWYCIKERRFIEERESKNGKYHKIDIYDLGTNVTLQNIIGKTDKPIILRLRTLLQYFGTNIVRDNMGEDIWINATMYKVVDIAQTFGLCIIPDVRFVNEYTAIRSNFLYGGVISIIRDKVDEANHSSEVMDFGCEYTIENNNTKTVLFYNVLKVFREILNKAKDV